MSLSSSFAYKLGKLLLDNEQQNRLDNLVYKDAGYGYDSFGMHPDWIFGGLGAVNLIYKSYFRVESKGAENIPTKGPGILAVNHSGTLPIDGVMLWADVLKNTNPARIARPIADNFVPKLPFAGTLFARSGMVGGSKGNARRLLETGELLMIFPEGVPGIGKPFKQRYELQDWRVGHAELAIRYKTPIIPTAIIGAEEQLPQIGRIPGISLFGAPYIPITAVPIPLPVKYHIIYGKPIEVNQYQPSDSYDPSITSFLANKVKEQVQELISEGLQHRKGIFL